MTIRLVLLITMGFLPISALRAQEKPTFRAGAAAVDISPRDFPVNMVGNFGENFAERNNDPLHARAMVFDDGSTKLAIVVVDSLGVAADVCVEAKTLAAKKSGIPIDRIVISATHTHSAPASSVKDGPKEAVAYRNIIVEGIAAAIIQAESRLKPALIGTATHPLPDEVFNRRWFLKPGYMVPNPFGGMDIVKMNPGTNPAALSIPAGPTDPDVTVISVQDAETKKPMVLYASYSLHYVGATPRKAVSADYYGEFARRMPVRMRMNADGSDGFVAILSNGTSGDINNVPFNVTPPRPPREPFEQIRIVAGKTADAAWQAHRKIETHRRDVKLGMIEREITLKYRKPTAALVERAERIVNLKDPAELAKLPRLAVPYAHRTLAQAKLAETITVPLQVIRIGDFAFCSIPFETFAQIGLDIKQRSPFARTLVVGISNGYNGYLPTPEQHKLGGYETWLGTNRVQEDASVIITDNLLDMLGELKKQK